MLSDLLNQKPLVCSILMDKVEEYFQNEENEKKYQEWYERKYGKPYSGNQI